MGLSIWLTEVCFLNELTVRDPHRCGCCFLSAFVRHRHHGCHALLANVGFGGESASAPPLELDAHPLRKVFVLHRLVALAGACFEPRTIEDGNPAAAIANDAALLQ